MPYDQATAERVRAALRRRRGVTERKMFGGLAFLVNGHMAAGVLADLLVLRLGDEDAAAALGERYTKPMDFTGRPLKSMVYVEPAGFRTGRQLKAWLDRALRFVRTLPPK